MADSHLGVVIDHVTGTDFFWDRNGVVTDGTITAISGEYQGPTFDMTGMDLDVAKLNHDVALGDHGKIINDFLGGDDQETGSAFNDGLFGYGGDDTLDGKAGHDALVGGMGQDILTGGAGHDKFVFTRVGESTNESPDTITDLTNKDVIDLHRIDPDLQLVAAFDGHAHELTLTYDAANDRTSLQADLDGDGHADMTVWIAGDHHDFTRFET